MTELECSCSFAHKVERYPFFTVRAAPNPAGDFSLTFTLVSNNMNLLYLGASPTRAADRGPARRVFRHRLRIEQVRIECHHFT